MKRFLSVLMAAVMCVSLSGTALAAGPSSPGHTGGGGGGGGSSSSSSSDSGSDQNKDNNKEDNQNKDLIQPSNNGEGDSVLGYIVDADGNEIPVDYEENKDNISFIPAGDADNNDQLSSEQKQKVKDSYNKLANLVQQNKLGTIPGLDEKIQNASNGQKTANDLVVTETFTVSMNGLVPEGAGLKMNLNLGSPEEGFATVLVERNGEWVELENMEVNEDGTVTCVLQEGDQVAIVKEGQSKSGSLLNRVVKTVKNVVKNAINSLFGLF